VITWIVLGVVGFALLVLVLVTLPLLRRLGRLRGVQQKLQRRAVEAQALVSSAEALQERAAGMQETLQTMADRAAIIQAKRS
jgi:hypothetical protein